MGAPCVLLIYVMSSALLPQLSLSSTTVVDGLTPWNNPTAHIGDSIIFKHEYEYRLYIFKNKGAFDLCNFTQATLLTNPNSTSFTWHPSRSGNFYFSFNNGSSKPCQEGQKLAIKVSVSSISPPPEYSATSPEISPSAPNPGGTVSSSPTAFPWPFKPRESISPSPVISTEFLPNAPALAPGKGSSKGLPFINSNPVVPFPIGEVDSATIRPIPTSQGQVVMGWFTAQMALSFVALLVLLHT